MVQIVVIGAGLSGLVAASELLKVHPQSSVLVLEASDRIGGRVQSCQFANAVFDLGAAWIHGTEKNPICRFLDDQQLKQVGTRNPWLHPECTSYALYQEKQKLPTVDEKWQLYGEFMKHLQCEAEKALSTESLEDGIARLVEVDSEFLKSAYRICGEEIDQQTICMHVQFFKWLIECWMGLSANCIQLVEFVEIDLMGDNPGPHCVVPKGMAQIIDCLSSPLKEIIRLDSEVTEIKYSLDSEDPISVRLKSGVVVLADFVILTVSLGVLKHGSISFSPELPAEKVKCIKQLQMGSYKKVLLSFPECFWSEKELLFGRLFNSSNASDFPLLTNYFALKNVPVLEAMCIGDTASKLDHLPTEKIVDMLMIDLRRTFGDSIPYPIDYFITNWDKNPHIRGAYSCFGPNSEELDPETLGESINDRLFFAGEATDPLYQGSLQAAFYSGIRVAKEITHILNKRSGEEYQLER